MMREQILSDITVTGFRRAPGLSRKAKGFTLIEMLIVAALISIFSAIAVINVQAQLQNNRRKAVIGEARSIATAMDFAYNDIGFFPSLGFLKDGKITLEIQSEKVFTNTDTIYGDGNFQHYQIRGGNAAMVQKNWAGPYHASTQGRSRVSQGRGGSSSMVIYSSDPDGIIWPLDALNNPWMMYNLHLDNNGTNGDDTDDFLYFTVAEADNSGNINMNGAGVTGNYVNAIVSYGDNQVPGGGAGFRPNGVITSPALTSAYGLRLYTGNPDSATQPLQLLTGGDLFGANGNLRASAWSSEFFSNAGGSVGILGLSDDNSTAVGISDPGSDDIIFTF